MDYRKLFAKENESVAERYELVMERICGIPQESTVAEPFKDYFAKMAGFIGEMARLYEVFEEYSSQECSWIDSYSMNELREMNKKLYEDILPDNYDASYGNPAYAVKVLGEDYGQLLSFLYSEIRGMIACVYEGRKSEMTCLAELFMEIYSEFEAAKKPEYKALKKIVYWYVSDYSDVTLEYHLREQLDDDLSFMKDIVMKADLSDERYLYLYGEYIGDNELKTAQFLNRLSEDEIDSMAETFVDGFIRGFKVMGMDISIKKSVAVIGQIGFERVLRESVRKFEERGLTVHMYRCPTACIHKKQARIGLVGTSANAQYDYDHRQDQALYMDKAFNERRLSVLRVVYEKYKNILAAYAGPALQEVFGEEPFVPEIKREALKLSQKQQELLIQYNSQRAQLSSKYMDDSTMGYTIIAYPLPEIGDDFETIFRDTVRINTLDNQLYTQIQQRIIDALDQADYVRVKGAKDKNCTDICVKLCALKDASKETKFENCVADVNIPAGEVFTSPVLEGTNGTLNVSSVYLGGYNFMNLTMVFKDGYVTEYSCDNFGDEEENRRYIKENILKNHEKLPIGEFAIGTNTAAYVMAQKYQIIHKLPILIVEKTGPHFAVGDTCYSRSEEHSVYNPNGKEIVARSNSAADLRHTEPERAYFNCHTDITVPYDEIGEIAAVLPDGSEIDIIRNGRFVLPGTEYLNEAFQDI